MTKFFHRNQIPFYLIPRALPYDRYVAFQENARKKRKESILFLEHNPCLTGGIGAKAENLLVSKSLLEEKGVGVFSITRGGDFTAHEPGQIVGYIHMDLKERAVNLGDFLQNLNHSLLQTIQTVWGLDLIENPKAPGLYLESQPEKKILSIGVLAKSYFTSYGFALNGNNSLETFQWIRPCGGLAQDMVSLRTLGLVKDWELEKSQFVSEFTKTFSLFFQ
ncbi:lipoyl(octanoyl) transferase LipB [Leptospira sp. 96542]|nr:lipoyl(octanoyl) transferase LipB [Leptospira sp. 96542]